MMKFVILFFAALMIATTLAAPQPQVIYTPVSTYTNTNDATYRLAPATTQFRTLGYVQQPAYVYESTDAQFGQYTIEPITYVV